MQAGQIITKLNQFTLHDSSDWETAFQSMAGSNLTSPAYCNGLNLEEKSKAHGLDCCLSGYSGSLLCWEIQEPLESRRQLCYPAYPMIDSSIGNCNATHGCPSGHACYHPVLEWPQMILEIRGHDTVISISVGHPFHLYQQVLVEDYTSRWWLIPAYLPRMIRTMLWYIVSISLAMSILNIVPTYRLDGEYACVSALAIVLSYWFSSDSDLIDSWCIKWTPRIFGATALLLLINMAASMIMVFL